MGSMEWIDLSGYAEVVGSCKCGQVLLGSIKCGEFID